MNNLTELNFVDRAEKVILGLQQEDRRGNKKLPLTTSQIRNLLTMTNQIYNQAVKERNEQITEKLQSDLQYLKMRMAYESGREKGVKDFVEKAGLMKCIDQIKASRKETLLFCKYMEALVAYHRFHGGKDR